VAGHNKAFGTTRLWAGCSGLQFCARSTSFSPLQMSRSALELTQIPVPGVPRIFLPKGKVAGTTHLHLVLGIENEWSYISTPAISLHGVHRDNFFYFYLYNL
jgi:hypothetical protein